MMRIFGLNRISKVTHNSQNSQLCWKPSLSIRSKSIIYVLVVANAQSETDTPLVLHKSTKLECYIDQLNITQKKTRCHYFQSDLTADI